MCERERQHRDEQRRLHRLRTLCLQVRQRALVVATRANVLVGFLVGAIEGQGDEVQSGLDDLAALPVVQQSDVRVHACVHVYIMTAPIYYALIYSATATTYPIVGTTYDQEW